MALTTQQVHQKAPECPMCGGRLFLTDEYVMGRVVWFWECSLGCSMQYQLDGTPVAHKVVVPQLQPTGRHYAPIRQV